MLTEMDKTHSLSERVRTMCL